MSQNSTLKLKIGLLSPALFLSAFAQAASTELLEESLNVFLEVSTTKSLEQQISACGKLGRTLEKLKSDVENDEGLTQKAQQLFGEKCSRSSRMFQPFDSEPKEELWDTPLQCLNDNSVLTCNFNHSTGHGLVIVSGSHPSVKRNKLVCTLMAGEVKQFLMHRLVASNRCVVSNVEWDFYLHFQPARGERIRPDVAGVLSWPAQSHGDWTTIQIPKLLSTQCADVFSDALSCSPLQIILPTPQGTAMDVCSLQSDVKDFKVPMLSIESANSKWSCEKQDLTRVGSNESIDSKERWCLPWPVVTYNDSCTQPYIPRRPKPLLMKPSR
jgi:hypothetical protein